MIKSSLPLYLLAVAAITAGAQAQVGQAAPQVFFGVRPGQSDSGAAVGEVAPGGTAAVLGLQTGDVITWMNGAAVNSTDDMVARIRALRVGETVTVRVRRGNQIVELSGVAQAGTPISRPRRVGGGQP